VGRRQEPGAVDDHPEGDQPQSAEGLVNGVSYAVQAKKEHGKRLALRLVEDSEPFAAAGECEHPGVGRSIGNSDAAQQGLEAGIGAQRAEPGIHFA
jgi:hypothetical protein